jgi:L-seryl-tRNA(Ser) seleniumtransferase
MSADRNDNPYRHVPSVDGLLKSERVVLLIDRHGRELVLDELRTELEQVRAAIKDEQLAAPDVEVRCAEPALVERVSRRIAERTARRYLRAVNATGVVLHTGLGRAPLARAAREALDDVARSYAVLELDRATGERNRREDAMAELLAEVVGAEAATVVNNNAAATLLCLAALAHGRGVVVSRGQLVEIGGSFRIPDVMAQSGARLVEVGCTNKTHLSDYEKAIDDARNDVGLILRVHASNYRIVGFAEEPSIAELADLGDRRGLPVMDDLGSGCLVDLSPYGLPGEPLVGDSLKHGATVATFSGDKLLGGPQAGLIVGEKAAVEKAKRHPFYRAMRPDKLTLAALEATIQLYRDPARAFAEVPVLRMISTPLASIDTRARAIAARLATADAEVAVEDDASMVGGGSYAIERIPTRVVAVRPRKVSPDALTRALRLDDPPVFARIRDDKVILDPRTLDLDEDALVASAVERAAGLR